MRNRRAIFLYAILGLLVLGGLSPGIYKKIAAHRAEQAEVLSDEEQVELQHLIVKLKDRASACDYRYRQSTSKEALAAIVAGVEPCPVKLAPPTDAAAKRYLDQSYFDRFGMGGWSLVISRDGTIPADEACVSWKTVADLSRSDGVVDPPSRFKLLRARNKLASPAEGYTVVYRVKTEAVGKPILGITVPGFMSGDAFVYSEAEQRVVCAGAASADNTLDATYTVEELQRERELQLRRVLGGKMMRVDKR